MKYVLILVLFGVSPLIRAQLPAKPLGKTQWPAGVPVTGELVKALGWSDASGRHYVVASTTGIEEKPAADGEVYRSARLSVKQYRQSGATMTVEWEIRDGLADCPLDATARFVPEAIQVTDLDKNEVPEVWVMYRTACRGDVSPATLKLILYEGKTKYAMRGTTRVPAGENRFVGGKYRFDAAFEQRPAVFKTFAKSLWAKYRTDPLD
ncbi:hypothetical protein GCM10027299_07030 [Larkinella ripae]